LVLCLNRPLRCRRKLACDLFDTSLVEQRDGC
jgi:hypothetical protein